MAHSVMSNTLNMGKQAKYKQLNRELRAELDRFFVKLPNVTSEQREEIFQHARKQAMKETKELSLKKKTK